MRPAHSDRGQELSKEKRETFSHAAVHCTGPRVQLCTVQILACSCAMCRFSRVAVHCKDPHVQLPTVQVLTCSCALYRSWHAAMHCINPRVQLCTVQVLTCSCALYRFYDPLFTAVLMNVCIFTNVCILESFSE